MERRVTVALVLSLVLIFGYQIILSKLRPAPPPAPPTTATDATGAPVEGPKPEDGSAGEKKPEPERPAVDPGPALAEETVAEAAPDAVVDTERFRVVFSNRGASIRRILLKSPYLRGRNLDPKDESSWLPVVDEYDPETPSGALVDPSGRIPLDTKHWEIAAPLSRGSAGQSIAYRFVARNGLVLTKTFTVPDHGFHVGIHVAVSPAPSGSPEPGTLFRFFLRGVSGMVHEFPKESLADAAIVAAYQYGVGEAKSDPETLSFGDLRKATSNRKEITPSELLWVATLDKYFATVLKPVKPEEWLFSRAEGESGYVALTSDAEALAAARELAAKANTATDAATLALMAKTRVSAAVLVPVSAPLPGNVIERSFVLYAGPRDRHAIELDPEYAAFTEVVRAGFKGGCGLDAVVKPIATLLLFLLEAIHSVVGNWGVAIILLTVLVRLVILPLSLRQQIVMTAYSQRMGKLKPEMEKLQAKYKTNKQRLNQEMMKLYKEKGINPIPPLGGCLPLFITMPVFLGLFFVFSNSIVMRQSPFLWIDDLSQPDRLIPFGFSRSLFGCFTLDAINILPILMAGTWWVQQKLAPKPTDPQMQQQQKMLQWMPFLFLFMLYSNAAGLSLYWFVNSLLGIFETQFVRKRFMPPTPSPVPAAA